MVIMTEEETIQFIIQYTLRFGNVEKVRQLYRELFEQIRNGAGQDKEQDKQNG